MPASFFRGTQTVRDKCYVTHWGVGVSAFPEKSVMKVCGSTLLALRGGGWGSNFQKKKRFVRMSPKRGGGGKKDYSCCVCDTVNCSNFGRSGSVIFSL